MQFGKINVTGECCQCGASSQREVFLLPDRQPILCCFDCCDLLERRYGTPVEVKRKSREARWQASFDAYTKAYNYLKNKGIRDKSYAYQAAHLNEGNFKTSRGGDFSPMAVTRMYEFSAKLRKWPGTGSARDYLIEHDKPL